MNVNVKNILYKIIVAMYALGLSLLLTLTNPMCPIMLHPVTGLSATYKYVGYLLENEGTLYKDVWCSTGPLLGLLNLVGNKIAYYKGFWLIETVALWICAILIFKIARIWSGKVTAAFLTAAAFIWISVGYAGGNYAEEFSLLFILVFSYEYLQGHVNRYQDIVLGICTSLVLITNIYAGLVLLIVGVLSFKSKSYRLVATATVLPIVVFVVLATKGAIGYYINQVIVYPLQNIAKTDWKRTSILVLPIVLVIFSKLYQKLSDEYKLIITVLVCLVLAPFVEAITNAATSTLAYPRSELDIKFYDEIILPVIADTNETDTIQVVGDVDFYYVFSRRLPASKYTRQWEGFWSDKSLVDDFKSEVIQSEPKYIIEYPSEVAVDIQDLVVDYEVTYSTDSGVLVYRKVEN